MLRLQQEIAASLKQPDVAEVLRGLGGEPGGMSPAEFTRYFRAEIAKWGKVVGDAKIVAD